MIAALQAEERARIREELLSEAGRLKLSARDHMNAGALGEALRLEALVNRICPKE